MKRLGVQAAFRDELEQYLSSENQPDIAAE